MSERPLRIFHAVGPGDVIGTYEHWRAGRDDARITEVAYSGQFFDVAREWGARVLVISACPQGGRLRDGPIEIRQGPPIGRGAGGLSFHVLQTLRALGLCWQMLRFRADVAVIAEGGHWYVFALPALLGVRVVPSLHCTLYSRFRPRRSDQVFIRMLYGWAFRRCAAVLSASGDISRQWRDLTAPRPRPIFEFLPLYRPDTIPAMPQPQHERPFRVLFAGRIEADKGVFDLLEAARRLRGDAALDLRFDVCGRGGALDELQRETQRLGLSERFVCHGFCDRTRLSELLAACHVVVVPTRSDFEEGFNQVIAEAILAGRAVISSDVCPAVHYVPDAVERVQRDDPAAYADAIRRLANDPARLAQLAAAAERYRRQFFDESRSWAAALRRCLAAILPPRFRPPSQADPSPVHASP